MIKAGICTGRFYKNKAMFACCNVQGCKFARHSLNAPPEISRFSELASVLVPGYGSFVIFMLEAYAETVYITTAVKCSCIGCKPFCLSINIALYRTAKFN